MRVMLTGGSGMVGRNMLAHPAADMPDVLAPSRSELDLADENAVRRYLHDKRPDVVIHAAGKVGGIKANMADPVGFYLHNLQIGTNVLLAARDAGVRKVINLGSTCMYPRHAENPLVETSILTGELEPTNEGYALAKIGVQRLGQYLSSSSADFEVKTIIPCNLYGPFDKFDELNAHLIPAVLRKLHVAREQGDESVTIWGDGTARREFMYVGDLTGLLWRCCGDFDRLPPLMNAGIGRDFSITDYYEIAARIVGYEGRFIYDTSQPTGMKQKLASSELAAEWGWKAETDLHEGLTKTYEYFRANQ
jgi:GDP-L-fucose synthase